MATTKALALSALTLLGGAFALADEESLLIAPSPSAALEVGRPTPVLVQEGTLVLPRWQANDVGGSQGRYSKYAEPPQGAYLGRLQLAGGQPGKSALLLRLDAPGQPSSSGLLQWERLFPLGSLQLAGDRYHFYLYPVADTAVRQRLALTAETVLDDRKSVARLYANTNYLRLPKPNDLLNHRVDSYGLELVRPVGAGDLALSLGLLEYRNLDGLLRGTSWATYGVRYGLNLARLANVGAAYSLTQVNQGSRSPQVQVLALSATSPAAANLVATAYLGSRRLTGAVERNGYTRASHAGRLELRYRGVRGLSLRGGYDRYEYDRVNRLHTATDETVWHRVWATAAYRPVRGWQVVAHTRCHTVSSVAVCSRFTRSYS